MPSFCIVCAEPTTTLCAGCKSVYYCKRECQRKHWNIHKKQCKILKKKFLEEKNNQNNDDNIHSQSKTIQKLLMMDYKLCNILESLDKVQNNDINAIISYLNNNNLDNINDDDKQLDTKKILFLDVDGVLNSAIKGLNNKNKIHKGSGLYVKCLKRLKSIIITTDCYIVLSSTWRIVGDSKYLLFQAMESVGIDHKNKYLGDTPNYNKIISNQDNRRTFEIKGYLNECIGKYDVTNWCAVDDMILDKGNECKKLMNGHFVNTNGTIGLTDINTKSIIDILN